MVANCFSVLLVDTYNLMAGSRTWTYTASKYEAFILYSGQLGCIREAHRLATLELQNKIGYFQKYKLNRDSRGKNTASIFWNAASIAA